MTAGVLAGGTWLFPASCAPKEAAHAETRSAAVEHHAPPEPRALTTERGDAGTGAVGRSTDAGLPFIDPVFSAACRGFEPKARVPGSPAPHCSGPAHDPLTGTRDRAARKKINEAIETHYFNSNSEVDLARLFGISNACETRCTAPIQAQIWMYIGVVYGSGRQDFENARCAFEVSLAWDSKVELDEEVVTSQTKAAFASARASRCQKF